MFDGYCDIFKYKNYYDENPKTSGDCRLDLEDDGGYSKEGQVIHVVAGNSTAQNKRWQFIRQEDGSYHIRRHVYGWGVVILSGETPVTLRGSGDEADYLPARNVAGEVFASLHAMQWAVEHGYTSIRIFYDYEGICKWATGDWKTNTPISIMYANTVRETYAPKLHVTFEKVEAHTGVMYNEMADQVAKSAVGL